MPISVFHKIFWKLILCFVDFFVHGQIQTDVRKSILPKYDSFPLNHGQKTIFDFILQNVSFCIQTTQRVVHTPSIFLCRFHHWMSFTDILRDREEGEGWSNCSSRLPSHLTLGSSMAITSPQVETRSPSHKRSQKVTKSHHESLAAHNSAVTVPQHHRNYNSNASPEKRHSSSLSRTPPAVASHSRVMSKSQNDTRVISKFLNDLKGPLRILFSFLWVV